MRPNFLKKVVVSFAAHVFAPFFGYMYSPEIYGANRMDIGFFVVLLSERLTGDVIYSGTPEPGGLVRCSPPSFSC